MASGQQIDRVFADSKTLVELFRRLQENLTKASDKNDTLLESIESSEARAGDSSEAPLLRNLRARLAAAHAPNSALRRDLATFSGLFEKRFKDLDSTVRAYEDLHKNLLLDQRDLEERLRRQEGEREVFEKGREEWKQKLERARQETIEQNDRLTVLSEQLAGTKVALDVKSEELASQRIAFEEEKLARQVKEGMAEDSEAELLRFKLKEQVLRNVELENALLRTELSLHQNEEGLRALETRNERLQQDILQARQASARVIKQFEKRTTEANRKLAQMNSELGNAQEHGRRFQELLTAERRKQKGLKHALEQELQHKSASHGGDIFSPAAQKAYIDTLSEALSATKKPRSPTRVEDIVRKNEATLVENANLKAEIRRLRIENNDLIRRVRFSDSNAYYMRNQVVTNIADRAELLKRLDKTESQYRELEQSLEKQASDWVTQRRKDTKTEKTVKWSQIQTIPVLGASERTWSSPSRLQPLSRSIQVQKW